MASTERRFRFLLFLFKLAGLPLENRKESLLHTIYYTSVSLCCYSVYLAGIYYVYMDVGNMESGVEATCHLLVMMALFCFEVNYRIQRNSIGRLFHLIESFTWEDMPHRDLETGELTMAGCIPRIDNLMKKLVPLIYGVHIIQSCVRIITSRSLMYDTLYPFDTSVHPVYEIILLTQVMAMFRISLFFHAAPYFYVTFVCVACTQLQKVKYLLLKMKQKFSGSETWRIDGSNEEIEALNIQKNFNDIVQLHQQVISYMSSLEEMMSVLLGGVLFFILLLQCTAAFAAVMSLENINDFSRAAYLYLSSTCIACIYCGFGTMLSHEYDSVSNAAFASDWVGTPVSFQNSISFMIAMSNQGFTLTAAKFVPVSNSTLMSMINESMSLFMFLLTMKDKGN